MNVDTAVEYALVEPDKLGALRESLSGIEATQAAQAREMDRLYELVVYSGAGLAVAVLIVALVVLVANRARRRDIQRNAEMIAAQEERLSKFSESLALASARMEDTATRVEYVGDEFERRMQTAEAELEERFAAAAEQITRAASAAEQTFAALLVQLQTAMRGEPGASA